MDEQSQMQKNAKEMDPQMKIYLIVAPGCTDLRTTVGFKALGSREEFTFAFSTPEKVWAFVNYQKGKGIFGNTWGKNIISYWLTLEGYFARPDSKLLYIDPPTDFPIDFGLPNLN